MTFRLENNSRRKISYLTEFDETSRFWYPHVTRVAWIDFSSWTVELRPSKYRENLSFCFSFPFLSLSPYPFASSLLSLLFIFLLSFHFFSFIFYFLHFSLFSSFLISLDFLLSRLIKVGLNFPPFSSHAFCLLHTISLFSYLFFFPFITSFNTWLHVSHLF